MTKRTVNRECRACQFYRPAPLMEDPHRCIALRECGQTRSGAPLYPAALEIRGHLAKCRLFQPKQAGETCPKCDGAGLSEQAQFPLPFPSTCKACHGRGTIQPSPQPKGDKTHD